MYLIICKFDANVQIHVIVLLLVLVSFPFTLFMIIGGAVGVCWNSWTKATVQEVSKDSTEDSENGGIEDQYSWSKVWGYDIDHLIIIQFKNIDDFNLPIMPSQIEKLNKKC